MREIPERLPTALALGVDLTLTETAEGGRRASLAGGNAAENSFRYRPNWGLPGRSAGEQTAGPVFGFSSHDIAPGADVRAVLVGLFIDQAPWASVRVGDVLRMYEGLKVCGLATVRWTEPCKWHPASDQAAKWSAWLAGQGEPDAI